MPRGKPSQPIHPAQQFAAPAGMERGVPLKEILGSTAVRLLAESFQAVHPGFDARRFQKQALRGIEELGIMQRGASIARALAEELPSEFSAAANVLLAALGPPLERTAGNGMAVFFYLPHSFYIVEFGTSDFTAGMRACHALTQRYTAEFCVRPFLVQHQAQSLKLLGKWSKDPSPHVRRLVSEGTRPRLPWASRLPKFQRDPTLALPLLEQLKDDADLYVRRSVANHLGDLLKDHPEFGMAVCERWWEEVSASEDMERRQNRGWVVRHAVRLPAKKGNPRAQQLRRAAGGR